MRKPESAYRMQLLSGRHAMWLKERTHLDDITYSVSQKNPPPQGFLTIFPKRFGIFGPNFTQLLYVPIYLRSTTNFYPVICNFDEVVPH